MNNNFIEKARKVLSPLELDLFMIMNGRNGTLFLQGHPGGAKSAVLRAIAKKMDFMFVPMWAPAMDEMDVGLYPSRSQFGDMDCVDYVPPKWALEANACDRGVIVVIEEFNRNERLMAACMSITNERQISHRIRFEDHVLFAVTGNLGDEDGTSVDVLDSAQAGRMIIRKQSLEGADGLAYWKENFALEVSDDYPKGRIHKDIIAYLDSKPHMMRPIRSDSKNDGALQVDARRWTQLSDFIHTNFGPGATLDVYGDAVSRLGAGYIGNHITEFMRFVAENVRPTLADVLKGKVEVKNRDAQAEILHEALDLDQKREDSWVDSISKPELDNLIEFLRQVDDDARTGFLIEIFASTMQKAGRATDAALKLNATFPEVMKYRQKYMKNAATK